MATSYYGSRISENMTKTPEGFLVCHNVPVARTGDQEYSARELGLKLDGMVNVHRSPEEVFHPATIASFEGKTVTDGHPPDLGPGIAVVHPANDANLHKGHLQNVRRGTGDESDLLLADLFVKDAGMIDKINGGLREVSCGYDCDWIKTDDPRRFEQKNIRGNHVAVVPHGRAGERVRIRDAAHEEKPAFLKGFIDVMAKVTGNSLFAEWARKHAADASPEEIDEAYKLSHKKEEDCSAKDEAAEKEKKEAADKKARDEEEKKRAEDKKAKDAEGESELDKRMTRIEAALAKLAAAEEKEGEASDEKKAEDAMKALEKSVGDEGESEEDKKKREAAEKASDSETIESGESEEAPATAQDAKILQRALIKAARPVLAAITDAKARKRAIDALTVEVGKIKPASTAGDQVTTYANLLMGKRTSDAKPKMTEAEIDAAIEARRGQPIGSMKGN